MRVDLKKLLRRTVPGSISLDMQFQACIESVLGSYSSWLTPLLPQVAESDSFWGPTNPTKNLPPPQDNVELPESRVGAESTEPLGDDSKFGRNTDDISLKGHPLGA